MEVLGDETFGKLFGVVDLLAEFLSLGVALVGLNAHLNASWLLETTACGMAYGSSIQTGNN